MEVRGGTIVITYVSAILPVSLLNLTVAMNLCLIRAMPRRQPKQEYSSSA